MNSSETEVPCFPSPQFDQVLPAIAQPDVSGSAAAVPDASAVGPSEDWEDWEDRELSR